MSPCKKALKWAILGLILQHRTLRRMRVEGEECWGRHVSCASGAIFDPFERMQSQKTLKWAILGLNVQQRGVQGECRRRGDTGGVQEECSGACLLSEQSERGRVVRAV